MPEQVSLIALSDVFNKYEINILHQLLIEEVIYQQSITDIEIKRNIRAYLYPTDSGYIYTLRVEHPKYTTLFLRGKLGIHQGNEIFDLEGIAYGKN